METNWIITQYQLPNDEQLKLVSIRDGNYIYHDIAKYNVANGHWMSKDDSRIPDNLSVRAWADLLPIYIG